MEKLVKLGSTGCLLWFIAMVFIAVSTLGMLLSPAMAGTLNMLNLLGLIGSCFGIPLVALGCIGLSKAYGNAWGKLAGVLGIIATAFSAAYVYLNVTLPSAIVMQKASQVFTFVSYADAVLTGAFLIALGACVLTIRNLVLQKNLALSSGLLSLVSGILSFTIIAFVSNIAAFLLLIALPLAAAFFRNESRPPLENIISQR